MLETRKLCKIYRPKRGVPVRALDDVTLKFPDRGMVFLLGKSGSGKSTLLNLLGGLDRYDSGEITMHGVSSKSFRQADFDTYRNTYVGFIFQEYNILEEFSVGANIALAIELQGRRATDDELNRILHEVDLDGYGDRKPNELSGGQKQRVAIARALIKNPEIIMADEPTGALDSATGRAVLDTLKRLSEDKLVIVVSHDREFAEQYADRIIELSDGKVISDIEYISELEEESSEPTPDGLCFEENTIKIPQGYQLSEEDRAQINRYLAEQVSGKVTLRSVGKETTTGTKRRSRPTDPTVIPSRDGSTFRRIKSRLPLRNAFKIGTGALKYKKFRLTLTILLSCVAFVLFGLSDTFGAYDHIRTCSRSLADSGITYASLHKLVKTEGNTYFGYQNLKDEDIAKLREDTGLPFLGVWDSSQIGINSVFSEQYDPNAKALEEGRKYGMFASRFFGFSEVDAAELTALGHPLIAGVMPQGGQNEIAIGTYVLESFLRGGYREASVDEDGSPLPYTPITSAYDMIGKTLLLEGVPYTVTGVFDDGLDLERYLSAMKGLDNENISNADLLLAYALQQEFYAAQQYSYAGVALVGKGFIENQRDLRGGLGYFVEEYGWLGLESYTETKQWIVNPLQVIGVEHLEARTVAWLDGPRTTLGEKEVLVSSDLLASFFDYDTDKALQAPENEQALFAAAKMLSDSGICSNMMLTSYPKGEYPDLSEGWKVVGIVANYEETKSSHIASFIVSDDLYNQMGAYLENVSYSFAIAPMPDHQDGIRDLVAYCYNEDADVQYPMQNAVTFELDVFDGLLEALADIFWYIGVFFAVFAALMLANFIGNSVTYKKQEIGILRAIGSRSNDVFRIFFSEAFVIAMINFVLSCIGTALITGAINRAFREDLGILITLLQFGYRQMGLLLLISLAVAAAASFLPVRRIAAKRPIDAIRNK